MCYCHWKLEPGLFFFNARASDLEILTSIPGGSNIIQLSTAPCECSFKEPKKHWQRRGGFEYLQNGALSKEGNSPQLWILLMHGILS